VSRAAAQSLPSHYVMVGPDVGDQEAEARVRQWAKQPSWRHIVTLSAGDPGMSRRRIQLLKWVLVTCRPHKGYDRAFAGVDRAEEALGRDQAHIWRDMRWLRENGYLERVSLGGGKRSNVRDQRRAGRANAYIPGLRFNPIVEGVVDALAKGADSGTPKGAETDTQKGADSGTLATRETAIRGADSGTPPSYPEGYSGVRGEKVGRWRGSPPSGSPAAPVHPPPLPGPTTTDLKRSGEGWVQASRQSLSDVLRRYRAGAPGDHQPKEGSL
jgi:hypothetical protein